MPIITPGNIKEEFIRFADLGNTINKRNTQKQRKASSEALSIISIQFFYSDLFASNKSL